jgi:hypothetical protein
VSPRTVYRHVTHTIRHVPEGGGITYKTFCTAPDCGAESGANDEQESAQDWALRHTGRTGHDLFRRVFTDHASRVEPPPPAGTGPKRRRPSHQASSPDGRSATGHGVPPKRDASKLSLRLQGDPLMRVARGTAAHPARSRLRHRGPASDQAAQRQRSGRPEARRKPDAPARRAPGRRRGDGRELAWAEARRWAGRLRGLYPPPRPGARVGQGQGATRSNSGQDHDLPELPGQRTAP